MNGDELMATYSVSSQNPGGRFSALSLGWETEAAKETSHGGSVGWISEPEPERVHAESLTHIY